MNSNVSKPGRILALDSIRGLLLLQMTLDHFSGPISRHLYQCFGFFSAAEGFFFLSGFVGMLAVKSKTARGENSGWMRTRAFRIWKFHMATLVFIALLAFFLLPSLQKFFTGLYEHPVSGSLFAGLLAYTPEWLDVLPLYVFLLLFGSLVFPAMIRGHLKLAWGVSFGIWLCAQFSLRSQVLKIFPDWIYPGFFDLFAWQFIYFSGAAISFLWKSQKFSSAFLQRIFPASIFFCAFCFVWSHQMLPFPRPSDFWISKEHVGALRYLNFLAFVGVISSIVRRKPNLLDFSFCRTIGRHSLEVFTGQTICVYLWMATPARFQFHAPFNVLAPILCCALLFAVAKRLERNR